MKIIIIHETENGQQIDEFKSVEMVEFEDQRYLKNGMWLHIYEKNKPTSQSLSVEIDDNDWFRIIND